MFNKVETRSISNAMIESDHNFTVGTVPLSMPDGTNVPDKLATVRTDTGQYLGTVGKGYKVVQPDQFYSLAQEFMINTGAIIDQTVTMKDSAVIGLSLKVNTREYLPGDPIEFNFLMMTSFNMQFSILGRALSRRLFCLNQLPNSNALFDIKHTTFAEQRLNMAVRMIQFFGKEQRMFDDKMKMLVRHTMSELAMVEWFRSLFPRPNLKTQSKRAASILENNTAQFISLLNDGEGVEVPGLRGTAYHALNALTEYVNHHRSTRVKADRDANEVKWESTVFGSGNTLMQKGFKGLIEMVKSEPNNKYVPIINN